MSRRKCAPAALLLTIAATAVALVVAGAGSAKQQRRSRRPGSTSGPHNDGGWSQAHDAGRLYVQKSLGSKVQTTYKENVPEGPQLAQVIDEPRPARQQDHLRDLVRVPGRDVCGGQEVPGRALRDGDRRRTRAKNMAEYFGAGEDTIFLSGMAAGAATKTACSATSSRSRSRR